DHRVILFTFCLVVIVRKVISQKFHLMPYKSRIEELIRKVFTGEASVQEVRSFFQNIRSDDDLDEGILPDDLLEETGTGESIPDWQLDKIWSKIELETKPRYQRQIEFPVVFRVR